MWGTPRPSRRPAAPASSGRGYHSSARRRSFGGLLRSLGVGLGLVGSGLVGGNLGGGGGLGRRVAGFLSLRRLLLRRFAFLARDRLFRIVALFALGDAGGIEEAHDAVGGLRALLHPGLHLFEIELEALGLVLGHQRIEMAEPLDEAAVARRATVGDDDMIDRPLLGAGAGETNDERHLLSSFRLNDRTTARGCAYFFFPRPGKLGGKFGKPGTLPGMFGGKLPAPGNPPGIFFANSAICSGLGCAAPP